MPALEYAVSRSPKLPDRLTLSGAEKLVRGMGTGVCHFFLFLLNKKLISVGPPVQTDLGVRFAAAWPRYLRRSHRQPSPRRPAGRARHRPQLSARQPAREGRRPAGIFPLPPEARPGREEEKGEGAGSSPAQRAAPPPLSLRQQAEREAAPAACGAQSHSVTAPGKPLPPDPPPQGKRGRRRRRRREDGSSPPLVFLPPSRPCPRPCASRTGAPCVRRRARPQRRLSSPREPRDGPRPSSLD